MPERKKIPIKIDTTQIEVVKSGIEEKVSIEEGETPMEVESPTEEGEMLEPVEKSGDAIEPDISMEDGEINDVQIPDSQQCSSRNSPVNGQSETHTELPVQCTTSTSTSQTKSLHDVGVVARGTPQHEPRKGPKPLPPQSKQEDSSSDLTAGTNTSESGRSEDGDTPLFLGDMAGMGASTQTRPSTSKPCESDDSEDKEMLLSLGTTTGMGSTATQTRPSASKSSKSDDSEDEETLLHRRTTARTPQRATTQPSDSLSGYDRRFPPATRLPPTVKAPSVKMSRLKILWDLSQLNVGHLQSGNVQMRGMTTLRLRPIKCPGNRGQKL
jgi:hypothetical protein